MKYKKKPINGDKEQIWSKILINRKREKKATTDIQNINEEKRIDK